MIDISKRTIKDFDRITKLLCKSISKLEKTLLNDKYFMKEIKNNEYTS